MKKYGLVIISLLCLTSIFADGARYLIITHDNFYHAIQPLAEWKQKKGIITKVTKLSEIGSTSTTIKNYITNAYNTWNPRPEYVLLVGDTFQIKTWRLGSDSVGLILSDNPYADMNNDTLADIFLGRLPCSTEVHCNIMVNKIFSYERNPYIVDTLWYRKGNTIQQDPTPGTGGIYWQRTGVLFVRNLMLNAGYLGVDTLVAGYPTGNIQNLIDSLNQGRSYVLYTGHASRSYWHHPFTLHPEDINLQNEFKLPVIVSWSCWSVLRGSGSLGERWLKAGSMYNLKGAVAYMGTTTIGTAEYRSPVARNFFRSVFQHNIQHLGKAFNIGRESLWTIDYPYTDTITRHHRYLEWNLLGDPELNLWTAVPKPMLVAHETIIPTGEQLFTVIVRNSSGPIPNALVCVMMPNDTTVYKYDYSNSNGIVNLPIYPTQTGWLYVTVTARNHIPYEDSCQVIPVSAQATYPNQGKHLVRKPNSSELHRVFEADGKVFYQMSSNFGQDWLTPTYLGDGNYPCISIGPMGRTPWVIWGSSRPYGPFYSAVKRTDGTWNIREIFPIGEELISNPSMVHATIKNEQGDLAYSVFRTHNRILFGAYDTLKDYCVSLIDDYDPSLAPSISITPEDRLHVVWQRDYEDGKIFYKEARKVLPEDIRQGRPPNWSEPFEISEPGYTAPASNPSTEAYGEFVYAAWRGPNEGGNPEFGDIWRRRRKIWSNPDDWYPPENKSETRDNESNFPVMSTDFVTVWHESIVDNNWDIWGRFEAEPNAQPFFQTEMPSKYPHIHGFWDKEIAQFLCYTIWTEKITPSLYEVKFDRRKWIPSDDEKEKVALYYPVEIGNDSASPYCLERDGYLTYGSYSVDYSDQTLKYKLPFLNPQYSYLLRAIVYRTGVGNWIEDVYVDSTLTATILSEPYTPETVWITIPQELYEYDTEIEKEIERIIGRRALIADLRVYQVELFDSTGGGSGPQSSGNALIQRPILFQSYPNPAKMRTAIKYSLPVAGKVSLQLYDISGRLVKTLVDEYKNPGTYSITLNSKSASGGLSAGVYFYRLKCDRFADTKRMVLIR